MRFEKAVIDKILNLIKKNQVYFTQKENLPQLAKLGYMYNSLWYSGRLCWGYNGILTPEGKGKTYGECENNPKYKIEMCDPENEEIENYIYDAWGMHVENNAIEPSFDEFYDLVVNGKELTEIKKKFLKPNKTFDEWVECLTHPDYAYSDLYPNRKSVADHLLCVIGNGFGFKNGFIIYEASGADQDISDYGDWQNAKFEGKIKKVVDGILAMEIVKQTLDAAHAYTKAGVDKRNAEILERDIKIFGMSFEDYLKSDECKELHRKVASLKGEEIEEVQDKYCQYYPISDYSIITKFDKNTHESYLKAGIEICEEILAHESEERQENVKFAKMSNSLRYLLQITKNK